MLRTDGAGILTWVNSDAGITADVLDFTQLADSLTLDASTSITASGTDVLSIINTGTGNSFLVNDQAADTSPFVIDLDGNVGIGTTAPSVALEVNGAIVSQSKSNALGVTNINFITGNVQVSLNSTNNAAFNVCGLKDGGSYTLILKAQPNGSIPTFAAFSDAACSTSITNVDAGGVTLQVASATTILTFIRAGATVYVMLATGFTQ